MSGARRFATDNQRRNLVNYWTKAKGEPRLSTPVGKILVGLTVTTSVVVAAVIGYVLNGWSWGDALYMVIITIFGVGYGETQPIDTPMLRWLTIGLIVCGYVAAIYTVGGFAQLLIDGELRRLLRIRRMQKEIDRLENHIIICGFGRMGSKLAESLATRGKPLIVIDQERFRIESARSYGCLAIEGNATEEQVLRAAGVERAAVLTTVLSDDVANLFITITAHQLNPTLEILARAEQKSTIKKLRQVGASSVILPASIGADRLANMILRPSAESLLSQAELPEGLNEDLARLGVRLDELEVQQGSSLIGGTIADLCVSGGNPFLIIAHRSESGVVTLQPEESKSLQQGDCVIILAHTSDITQLCTRFALQSELEPEIEDEIAPTVQVPSVEGT